MVFRALEDNTTCIGSVEKGYSPAMRYLPRTQQTSLGFLHEVFCENDSSEVGPAILQHASSKKHKGDFFTKDSLSAEEFQHALISLRIHESFEDFLRGERKNLGIKPQKSPMELALDLGPDPTDQSSQDEG